MRVEGKYLVLDDESKIDIQECIRDKEECERQISNISHLRDRENASPSQKLMASIQIQDYEEKISTCMTFMEAAESLGMNLNEIKSFRY